MGSANSRGDKTEALKMCKLRKKMIEQAIESRYSIAASHVSYIQALKNIGVILRRFAEVEMLCETTEFSVTAAAADNDDNDDNNDDVETTVSDNHRLSYMKSGGNVSGNVSLTFRYNPSTNSHVFVGDGVGGGGGVGDGDGDGEGEGEGDEVLVLPPPPPPPECGSWDYFTPGGDVGEGFRFVGGGKCESVRMQLEKVGVVGGEGLGRKDGEGLVVESSGSKIGKSKDGVGEKDVNVDENEEREDASEFITHRAKDFLSSIKDIEQKFFRASESGKEVARLLEANKIRVGFAEAKGRSSPLSSLAACPLVCCRSKSVHDSNDLQSAPKVIVWNRSMSSQSSSSRNLLGTTSKDDADDSGSECIEDFFMISGSHSSTLERLYAWERKLHDEVKASEVIRKEYDKKCGQLRHQFAKNISSHVIDKNRAVAKDLHSRIRVALHSVDSIAKRIEKMRDEELLPQLTELTTGFIRMWKAMLECHHAQYITISLAYHAKTSLGTPLGDTRKEIMNQLQYEFECFGVSFADWMNSHTSYVAALNGWLQNCVMQPQERTRGSRRPFSPRRVLAPPIFVLCRDWSVGITALPSEDVSDAIRNFLIDLHHLVKQQQADENKDTGNREKEENVQAKDEGVEDRTEHKSGNLGSIHTSLTKVLDKLTKFSEASLKLYEDIRQKSETARVLYSNPRPFRY